MLVKNDPLSAVDVYTKFPVSEKPSFDDAYIFGEIVRILMKAEKFDDPRLAPNMITYGKILGLGNKFNGPAHEKMVLNPLYNRYS